MRRRLPDDVDLTLKMDFNVFEPFLFLSSIKLHKEQPDYSYKRYHTYRRKQTTSTTGLPDNIFSFGNDSFQPRLRRSSTSTSGYEVFYLGQIEVEEKVCWRKLHSIHDELDDGTTTMTVEQATDLLKNFNFALGSKQDRLNIAYKKHQQEKEFCAGYYCDRCGRKLNHNNCLIDRGSLCKQCWEHMMNPLHEVALRGGSRI